MTETSRILPGDWGKVEPGWLAQLLSEQTERLKAEAEFTSSSGSVRALSVNAKKELSDEER
jgi:hypothetical protein